VSEIGLYERGSLGFLFAENFSKVSSTDNYSSQFKIHKQQVENNDHNNITDHFNNNSNCYNPFFPEFYLDLR
jgi:hypothetical protein